ncbi:GTPase activating protein [Thoreauomyces humboldtii]|nr:GTPase activating protein [Thoreauomyces humboldtii]
MQLLFALAHVSLRTDELNPSLGYLCLMEQEGIGYSFSWVPRSKIPRAELEIYLEVVAKTKKARKTLSEEHPDYTIINAPHKLSTVTESISTSVDDVETIALGRDLTLNGGGDEICLTRLVVALQFEGARLPDLWFEKDELGREASIVDVEDDLRGWFAAIGRDMTKVLRERDPEETAVLQYFSLDARIPASSSAALDPSLSPSKQWGGAWAAAVPEGSIIHRFGSLGFNAVTHIVGQPIATKIEDVGWNMLERFSKVTNYAKNTTVQVLEHPLARPFVPYIPQNVRSYFLSSAEAEALLEEYEPAGQYIARFAADLQSRLGRRPAVPAAVLKDRTRDYESLAAGRVQSRNAQPLSAEQWTSWYGADGKLTVAEHEIRDIVFAGGVENDVRVDVWRYLLRVYPYDSTEAQRAEISRAHRAKYEDIKRDWRLIYDDSSRAEAAALAAGTPLPHRESQAGDEREDADVVTKIRERKYRVDKDVVRTDRTVPFFASATEGEDDLNPVTPADMVEAIAANPNLEMLSNILVSYTMYNFELGYVQGMNDLLAPILVVMRDENDSFWCFVEFMEMTQSNFFRDQSGMRNQLRRLELLIKFIDPFLFAHMEATDSINLFCCFRWLLILFKREFEFSDTMRLWESLWACPLTKHFHLFVALAILNQSRQELMACSAFDETLKYINDLSTHIHLDSTLERAHVLFDVFKERVAVAARDRLAVDLAVDAPTTNDVLRVLTPSPKAGRERSRERESGAAGAIPAGTECSDEELWELIALLERR